MSERDRGIEINQRSLSVAVRSSSMKQFAEGHDAAYAVEGRAARPERGALSNHGAQPRPVKHQPAPGFGSVPGGTSSATTRSRSVTRMVSPSLGETHVFAQLVFEDFYTDGSHRRKCSFW